MSHRSNPNGALGAAGLAAEAAPAHLLRGAYSLLANTAVTSALGMGFWVLAARLYPPVTIGRDTVLISVMVELSTICQLNMGNAIVRFLPDLGRRSRRALGAAYGATAAAALALGVVFVLVAPLASRELAFLAEAPLLAAGFVAALALWGLFTLQDAALTATRRAPWIPLENGVFGLLKLLALPLLLVLGATQGVFLAWVLPMALLLLPVNLLLFTRAIPAHVSSYARKSSFVILGQGRALRFLAQDYLASIFTQATLTTLPLLVIVILGASQSAYFAIPFTIAMAFDTFAYGACSALVVEATIQSDGLHVLTGVFARRVGGLLVPAGVVLAFAAPLVMLPFGRAYVSHGAGVLRLLLCASLLRVVLALFSAVSRAQAKGVRLALLEFGLLTLVLGSAPALARSHGIEGVAFAWLVGNAIACAVATVFLLRFLRRPRPSPTLGSYLSNE